MRILVVGAGAIGGFFGGRLLAAGRDVTSEWIELERLAPVGRALLEPYCEIPPRTPARC